MTTPSADPVAANDAEVVIIDGAADAPVWTWRTEGSQCRSGNIWRAAVDSGKVRAEFAGDILSWLLQRGPCWDGLDQREALTITLEPEVNTDV